MSPVNPILAKYGIEEEKPTFGRIAKTVFKEAGIPPIVRPLISAMRLPTLLKERMEKAPVEGEFPKYMRPKYRPPLTPEQVGRQIEEYREAGRPFAAALGVPAREYLKWTRTPAGRYFVGAPEKPPEEEAPFTQHLTAVASLALIGYVGVTGVRAFLATPRGQTLLSKIATKPEFEKIPRSTLYDMARKLTSGRGTLTPQEQKVWTEMGKEARKIAPAIKAEGVERVSLRPGFERLAERLGIKPTLRTFPAERVGIPFLGERFYAGVPIPSKESLINAIMKIQPTTNPQILATMGVPALMRMAEGLKIPAIPKAPQPLISEAKKYKTAEEFVGKLTDVKVGETVVFESKGVYGQLTEGVVEKIEGANVIVQTGAGRTFGDRPYTLPKEKVFAKESEPLVQSFLDSKKAQRQELLELAKKDKTIDYSKRKAEIDRQQLTDIWKQAQVKPPEVAPPPIAPLVERPPEISMATKAQKAQAHIIAKEKVLVTPEGKTRPGYRRLAQAMTGKSSMKEMTQEEAARFTMALMKMPEPYYKKGQLVPPSIPKTTKMVPEGFFKKKFKEPTIAKFVTSQTYYSEKLGVKPFVEPLEIAKQKFDLAYRGYANNVDRMITKINKLGKTTPIEATQAKIRNIPTMAVSKMRDLLDKYEEAPAFLLPEEKQTFNWFRSLNRTILEAENAVRKSLDLEPIKYRKAYVRHTAEAIAQEMLAGRYPFPQGLKYWSQRVIGKKIFNPMEFQRQLADDLENLWTKDLAHATKSMLWTGLKEINLSQPLRFLNEQLGAVSKDPAVYKTLTPEEKEIYDQQKTIPASTKKWVIDYVNQVIKGQETDLDASINRLITNSGLKGIFNKILAPFGRTVGRKPITNFFQQMGRLTIHGVMGPIRPKQLIRNKFQLVQNLALYGLRANLKGFFPATPQMKKLMNESLFLKTYTGFEELPTNIQGKLERLNLAPFQWTAVSNVSQSMKVAYWDTLDLITHPKYKDLGWADPQRTYKEPKEFLYRSEQEKISREMEFGAGITQYGYIPMAMPEVFRYKSLIPFTRLQSWWMNHFFKFNREAISRGLKGETAYGAKLPWSRRINWLRYLILGGAILNTLDYERSFLFGAAPSGLPPTAQFMLGLYTFLTVGDKTAWQKRKKAEAKYRIFSSMKTFVPGYLAWKDFSALMSGEKQLREYFFYTKIKKRRKPINPILEKYGIGAGVKKNPILEKYGL